MTRFAFVAVLLSLVSVSPATAHEFDRDDGCCIFHRQRCDARPGHPDQRCRDGKETVDCNCPFSIDCPLATCSFNRVCTPDIPTGSVPETANGIDDDCDGFVDDEQCDGVDNDSDGMIDEDLGSCLYKIAVFPLCYQTIDAAHETAFQEAARRDVRFFFAQAGLNPCLDNVRITFMPFLATDSNSCVNRDTEEQCKNPDPPTLSAITEWRQRAEEGVRNAGFNVEDFDVVVAYTDRDFCGRTLGQNDGGGFVWAKNPGHRHDHEETVAHELGHDLGLVEEYCSTAAGSTSSTCSTGSPPAPPPPNFLGTDLSCDPLPGSCCQNCETEKGCCEGNQNPLGGRCIMSYAGSGGPKAFCERCAAHMTSPPNGRTETDPGGQARMDCSFSHLGAQSIVTSDFTLDGSGSLRVQAFGFARGRLGLAGEGGFGQYAIELSDEAGNSFYSRSFHLFDGLPLLGSSTLPASVPVPRALRAILPPQLTATSRIRMRAFKNGISTFRTTLNGRPPVANAGPDRVIECNQDRSATLQLDGTTSADPDGDTLVFQWSGSGIAFGDATSSTPSVTAPQGISTAGLVVNDGISASAPDTAVINVVDTTGPAISNVVVEPDCLWPPNHKLVRFVLGEDLRASASDVCDPRARVRVLNVQSNEPGNANGDGQTTPDVTFGPTGFCLRSERAGGGGGRVYTVTLESTDASGNQSVLTVPIRVDNKQCGKVSNTLFLEDGDPRCRPEAFPELPPLPPLPPLVIPGAGTSSASPDRATGSANSLSGYTPDVAPATGSDEPAGTMCTISEPGVGPTRSARGLALLGVLLLASRLRRAYRPR